MPRLMEHRPSPATIDGHGPRAPAAADELDAATAELAAEARARFDKGFEQQIDDIYRDRCDLFNDHRDDYGWVTGYLGDPFAPVWFVAENPSLGGAMRVRGAIPPTRESQWTISPGDKLFRRLLVKHGFKHAPADSAGGWGCYITDVIKSADIVKDFVRLPAERYVATAEAWAPALRWELEEGDPLLVVSVGKKADRVLNHLIKTRRIPEIAPANRVLIHHYVYVATFPDNKRNLPGGHPLRVQEYDAAFADIARRAADISASR